MRCDKKCCPGLDPARRLSYPATRVSRWLQRAYAGGLRAPIVVLAALAPLSLGAPLAGCNSQASGGSGGQGGGGGAGGACPTGPQPSFELTITTSNGPVPLDTSVEVTWSAGPEPVFMLANPTSWKTLAEANIVCDVNPMKPPPTDLMALTCTLWTSGATEVDVQAPGYVTYAKTLTPTISARCDRQVPAPVTVELMPVPMPDGGMQ
jgi:hypothetical protein